MPACIRGCIRAGQQALTSAATFHANIGGDIPRQHRRRHSAPTSAATFRANIGGDIHTRESIKLFLFF
jgi:hypothetical protein